MRKLRIVAPVAACLLLVAGCGGSGTGPSDASENRSAVASALESRPRPTAKEMAELRAQFTAIQPEIGAVNPSLLERWTDSLCADILAPLPSDMTLAEMAVFRFAGGAPLTTEQGQRVADAVADVYCSSSSSY